MEKGSYDVAVMGSGMGGLSAAALLAHAGYHTLLIEKRERLGGRFSTTEYQGFKLPTGAIGVQMGGEIESVFDEVGAEFEVAPVERLFYWIDGNYYELPEKGGMRALLDILNKAEAKSARIVSRIAKEVAIEKLMGAFRKRAAERERPEKDISFRDWLLQYTDNEKVLAVFQAIIAANHGINSWEVPAAEFFAFVSRGGGYRRYGIAPKGNVAVAESLGKAITANGGEVWTNTEAKRIIVKEGRVTGIAIQKNGKELEIGLPVVISNAGPRQTVALTGSQNFDNAYLQEMNWKLRPAPIVTTLVASDKPFIEVPGMVMVVGARRICSCHQVTTWCPDLAPPGKHLAVIFGEPLNSLQPMNAREEIEANIQDLRDTFPLFSKYASILMTDARNIDDEWPCYHTWPGYDLPPLTPIRGLYNVGDGVKSFGKVGLYACAESGRIVAEDIKKTFAPAK